MGDCAYSEGKEEVLVAVTVPLSRASSTFGLATRGRLLCEEACIITVVSFSMNNDEGLLDY